MDIHKPKPWHGFREFLKEYVIIVVGVLTALAAEQAAEWLHRHAELHEARAALDAEIAHNLASIQYTTSQAPCVIRRLDELSRWVRSGRDGKQLQLTEALSGPPGFIFRTAVWRVTSVGAVSQMPFEARVGYGQVYDSLDNLQALRRAEADLWRELSRLAFSRKLDEGQRLQADFDIGALRSGYTQLMQEDGDFSFKRHAREMGVTKVEPWRDQGEAEQWRAMAAGFCKPILATTGT